MGAIQLQSSAILGNTGVFSPVQLELFDSLGGFFEVDFGELEGARSLKSPWARANPSRRKARARRPLGPAMRKWWLVLRWVGRRWFSRRDVTTGTLLYEAGVPASTPLTDFTVYVDTLGIRETGLAHRLPGVAIGHLSSRCGGSQSHTASL